MITKSRNNSVIEYGDYQTPFNFSRSVCSKLRGVYSLCPTVVIEPTFGTGNFIESAVSEFDTVKNVYGIELNNNYYQSAKKRLYSQDTEYEIDLYNADIFSFDFTDIKENITKNDNVLIIGPPPMGDKYTAFFIT
jgi:ubiquinone/menaquinone biosynthesis C-methylase UbiE